MTRDQAIAESIRQTRWIIVAAALGLAYIFWPF